MQGAMATLCRGHKEDRLHGEFLKTLPYLPNFGKPLVPTIEGITLNIDNLLKAPRPLIGMLPKGTGYFIRKNYTRHFQYFYWQM